MSWGGTLVLLGLDDGELLGRDDDGVRLGVGQLENSSLLLVITLLFTIYYCLAWCGH